MPEVTHHEVEIRTDQGVRTLPGVGRDEHVTIYQPYCRTCGWVGDETRSERAARDAADAHRMLDEHGDAGVDADGPTGLSVP